MGSVVRVVTLRKHYQSRLSFVICNFGVNWMTLAQNGTLKSNACPVSGGSPDSRTMPHICAAHGRARWPRWCTVLVEGPGEGKGLQK